MKTLYRAYAVTSLLCLGICTPVTYAQTIDTSLLGQEVSPKTSISFAPKTFGSCKAMRSEIADFLELYFEHNRDHGGIMPYMREGIQADMAVTAESSAVKGTSADAPVTPEYSLTNTRTLGVDEPEMVKTDGKFIYSVRTDSERKGAVYIHTATDTLEPLAKIILPAEYFQTQLLVQKNKLVILAEKYVQKAEFETSWLQRYSKTVVAIYDIQNKKQPKLERYFQIDGNMSDVRLAQGKLTVMANTSFHFPYSRYMPQIDGVQLQLDTKLLSADFANQNVLPKRINLAITGKETSIQSAIDSARKKKTLQELDAAECSGIKYILPDEATLKNGNFSPSFTSITQISLFNPHIVPTTELLFGDMRTVYLSEKGNLYLVNQIYSRMQESCPMNGACILRWIEPTSSSVIHSFSTTGLKVKYTGSRLLAGTILSDYAIDEAENGNLRVVTQITGAQKESQLTILNAAGKELGKLTGLGKTENFKSARFIGNRLYLVTFKDIDPFYVIDLSDVTQPKVLGELKIPGYSTYLHPYDAERLIGIGYDTQKTQWGGETQGGIKIDLYNVSDVANPKQEGTLTLGDTGSSADALSDPRLFVWRKSQNTLYLPASITKAGTLNQYEYLNYFQGLVAVSIDPRRSEVIKLERTHTHIAWGDESKLLETIQKECVQYASKQKTCRKLLNGEEVCDTSNGSYIPPYCYADGGISAYKAQNIWSKSDFFIQRVLFSGDRVFTFSQNQIQSILDSNFETKGTRMYK